MRHLHRDLDRLKRQILSMGAIVESATDTAITALLERRPPLADEVIAGDARIDQREVELEEECLKILALHQPVAGDLRFIITVLKVNNDLERVGDLAVNIAERASGLASCAPIDIPLDVHDMAGKVRLMVRNALDSLVSRDVALARRVIEADDEVDDMHRAMFQDLHDYMRADPSRIERAVHMISASRNLERIADLATNIAEDVIFLVRGEVVRHGLNQ